MKTAGEPCGVSTKKSIAPKFTRVASLTGSLSGITRMGNSRVKEIIRTGEKMGWQQSITRTDN